MISTLCLDHDGPISFSPLSLTDVGRFMTGSEKKVSRWTEGGGSLAAPNIQPGLCDEQ